MEATAKTRRAREPAGRRRSRLARRALGASLALVLVLLAALLVRTLVAEPQHQQVVEVFGSAWIERDWDRMYTLLSATSQDAISADDFAASYADAMDTATVSSLRIGDASDDDDDVALPVTVSTHAFGDLEGELRVAVTEGHLEWEPHMVFPGLGPGEELARETTAPERAAILARDRTRLASGPASERTSELGISASEAAGTLGPVVEDEESEARFALGYPDDMEVGVSGIERVFELRLAGTPGGELRAGDRVLAATEPQQAEPVRTTIDSELQLAAANALAGFGGVVALDARSGEVRALTGLALTGPQPPGSTFKIITTVAALEAELVTPATEFPVETAATIDGVTLRNAHGSPCGGSFSASFVNSCNSVFAPLGVEVGAERLVETAERFGLNGDSAIPNATASTMPQPQEFESDLELGATAIGQGRLLMTPLRVAVMSQVIANGGRLSEPSLDPDAAPVRRRVTTKRVANTVGELMEGVVAEGTGTAAALADVAVAGKTGTAELGEDITEHAWFTAFAPAGERPELAIGVLVANGGEGGQVAAPVARTVLDAGL